MTAPVISHLYLFDDLTYHVRRLTAGWPSRDAATTLRSVGSHLNVALGGLDPARQDYTLFTWDGVTAQLAWELADRGADFDVLVSQGCNGEHTARSLLDVFLGEYCRTLASATANVRVTKYLADRTCPFYSPFQVGVSSGGGLAEQCQAALSTLTGVEAGRPRIAVFDDCIQTGKGTRAVAEELLRIRPEAEIWTLGLIACQATQESFRSLGWRPVQGLLQPGLTYPAAWDTDIYFTKDLVLTNAIRFADGTSQAYVDDDYWMSSIFAGDAGRATVALRALQNELRGSAVYDELLAL